MVRCVVKCCKNRSLTCCREQVSFFRLPNDHILREDWIQSIGEVSLPQSAKNARICSVHFGKESFRMVQKKNRKTKTLITRRFLLPTAVPTLNFTPAENRVDNDNVNKKYKVIYREFRLTNKPGQVNSKRVPVKKFSSQSDCSGGVKENIIKTKTPRVRRSQSLKKRNHPRNTKISEKCSGVKKTPSRTHQQRCRAEGSTSVNTCSSESAVPVDNASVKNISLVPSTVLGSISVNTEASQSRRSREEESTATASDPVSKCTPGSVVLVDNAVVGIIIPLPSNVLKTTANVEAQTDQHQRIKEENCRDDSNASNHKSIEIDHQDLTANWPKADPQLKSVSKFPLQPKHDDTNQLNQLKEECEALKLKLSQKDEELQNERAEKDELLKVINNLQIKLVEADVNINKTRMEAEFKVRKTLEQYFSEGQIRCMTESRKFIKWSSDEYAAAIKLRNISIQAYKYLKDKLNYPFPSLAAIRCRLAQEKKQNKEKTAVEEAAPICMILNSNNELVLVEK